MSDDWTTDNIYDDCEKNYDSYDDDDDKSHYILTHPYEKEGRILHQLIMDVQFAEEISKKTRINNLTIRSEENICIDKENIYSQELNMYLDPSVISDFKDWLTKNQYIWTLTLKLDSKECYALWNISWKL
jgi:hypothetical protein